MCLACGFYNGRLVIDMKAQAEKREARLTAKKEMIKGQQAEAAAAEEAGAPAPEQFEQQEDAKAAALENKAKQADAAQVAPATTKTQDGK